MTPEGWKVSDLVKLTQHGGVLSDGDWVESKDQDPNGDVRLVQLADVGDGSFLDRSARFLTSEKARELKCTFLQPGDLLIARMPDPLGRACVFPGDSRPSITAVDVCIVRPDPNIVDVIWLKYSVNSPQFRSQLKKFTSGTTRKRISRKNLDKITIFIPPLTEQRRIASILDKADAIRCKRQQARSLTDEFICSAFVDIFGDPVINPYKWKIKPLGNISIRFSDGPFGSNLKTSHYVDEGVRVVRLQNIGVDEFLDEDKAYISKDHFQTLLKHKCVPGDVIIGTLGDPNLRACILPSYIDEAINKADCIQLRTDHNQATPEYICSLINHPGMLTLAYHLMHGQTRIRVSMGTLKELEVPIPPLSIQKHYSTVYYQKKKITSQHQNMTIKTGTLFNSLTQRAFRGEL